MPTLRSSSAYDVKIESILVESDRLPVSFEIAPNVIEINIFENIDLPYLTGSIMITDSNDIFNQINFQGTEKITIRVKINEDDSARPVEKTFITTDIKVAPTHDTSEVLLINIVEDHAYLNNLITVSKSYSGKPEIIIGKILKDQMQLSIDVPQDFVSSASPQMRVVVPNMSPLDAARWVKNRMINENGMPFFLYSTLNNSNLFLVDLEHMLTDEPLNVGRPYSYGQAFNRFSTELGILEQARNIESYKLPRSENMFSLASSGALSSTYEFIDTVKEKPPHESISKIDMSEILNRMVERGIISNDQRGPIYDEVFKLNDKTFAEYNPSVMSQISSSNTYSDMANYYESDNIEMQTLKTISRAIRYYLLKSPIEIVMPGFEFLGRGPDITIGRQIIMNFLKNDPDILSNDKTDVLDKKRSGKYLVYACRHVIQPQKYSVSLACTKLANQE